MGAFTDYLTGGGLGDILGAAGGYALGTKNIEGAQELGKNIQAGTGALANQARTDTTFQPYAVTSGLANVATNQQGGFDIGLSPEQQAMQNQLMGQAEGLFGQVGQDPAQAQAALYEQMRGVQRPEEERQRLALEERMLSQGRLGLGSNAYGGSSPELLAQETAIQEAMARANLGARQQSQAEQLQAGQLGGILQQAGYQPQQQALSLLEASQIPAGYLSQGQRTGATLQSQLGQSGLEGSLQAAELGQGERLAQLQSMANLIGGGGTGASRTSGLLGGLDQYLPDWLTGGSSATPNADSFVSNSWQDILFGGSSPVPSSIPNTAGWLDQFIDEPRFYRGGGLLTVPRAIPTAGGAIDFGNVTAPSDFGFQTPTYGPL
jgi:hypothetical protein